MFGVRLDLVRWETHGHPGFGVDAQDVLNRELPDDPDIFIGLMWSRHGTPTGRAGSGTEKEFQRAITRFQQDSSSVKIMFYFKDAPIAPGAIDAEQLSRVQHFRSSIGSEGALYWNFATLRTSKKLIRLHLARQIQEFISGPRADPATVSVAPTDSADSSSGSDEEFGLLDYLDLMEERFGALNEITGRISTETGGPRAENAGAHGGDSSGDRTGAGATQSS